MAQFRELGPNVYGETEVQPRATSLPLSHAHPMLSVVDVDAALEYYRTALGFFVEWAQRDEEGSTTLANLWRGGLSLFLMHSDSFGPTRVYCHLSGRSELESLHADLVAAGATILDAPTERPWGLYEMRVADLDGNELDFACAAESG